MAATDVVKHDLKVPSRLNWDDPSEPLPIPIVRGAGGGRVAAPANATTTQITPPTIDTMPYRSVGRMLLQIPYLEKGVIASGWVGARRAFFTAGHCVYYEAFGGWITEAIFCPRFNVDCPGKTYTVETVFTLQGWLDTTIDEDHQYDMGACVVTELFDPSEPPLTFAVDSPLATQYATIGYPLYPTGKYQFNGKRMWQSLGDDTKSENSMIWVESDLSTGASGGPWCDPANNWVVGGLTGARDPGDDRAVSPVLSQGFQNLYDAVKNL